MAYVADNTDPNQQQPQAGQNAPMAQLPQTASGTGAGAGAANTTPAGSPQGAAAVPTATKAPPVQNLGDYLAANAPQAVQMGQNIAGNLSQAAGKVSGDINADQAAADAQIQASNTAPNPDLVSRAASDPAQFATNPQDIAAFQGQLNANYTGPSSYESRPEFANLTGEVQRANAGAPDITKPGGIEQLVTGQEVNPTAGMRNLDTLLLQGTPQATAPISEALKAYPALAPQLSNAATTENAAIQGAVKNTQAAPQAVRDAFLTGPNAVVPTWENNLNQEVQSAAGTYSNEGNLINALTQEMNNGDLSQLNPAQLSQLGLTPAQVSELMTTKSALAPFSSAPSLTTSYKPGAINPNPPTSATIATSEDYAKEAALEQLLGAGFSNRPLNVSKNNEAGTFNPVGTKPSFDSSGYATELANTAMPGVTPSWANLSGDTMSQKLQFLNFLRGIAPTQNPGQMDYLNPKQISLIDALKAMQGDLLPS